MAHKFLTYFASGTNHPAEIEGLTNEGVDVGACVSSLHSAALSALCALAMTARRVFMDSGAFSEIAFGPEGPFVVEEITDEEWNKRLDVYDVLGDALGSQLYAVAPDKVAFQAETLARLERYADRIRALRRKGANVIVAHQKGELSLAEFNRRARRILRIDDFVCGIPMAKDATSTEELVEFVRAARPSRVHLLGLGPKSARFAEVLDALLAVDPSLEIFCDSVLICSLVGRNNGRGGGPRPLTAAQDSAREDIAAALWGDVEGIVDYTDAIACPSAWLTRAAAERVFEAAGLSKAERKAAAADLDAWVSDPEVYENPLVDMALDAEWSAFVTKREASSWIKREGIARMFRAEPELLALAF